MTRDVPEPKKVPIPILKTYFFPVPDIGSDTPVPVLLLVGKSLVPILRFRYSGTGTFTHLVNLYFNRYWCRYWVLFSYIDRHKTSSLDYTQLSTAAVVPAWPLPPSSTPSGSYGCRQLLVAPPQGSAAPCTISTCRLHVPGCIWLPDTYAQPPLDYVVARP